MKDVDKKICKMVTEDFEEDSLANDHRFWKKLEERFGSYPMISSDKETKKHLLEQKFTFDVLEEKTVPATQQIYLYWLKGYVKNDGEITQYYDREFPYYPRDDISMNEFLVAQDDFKLMPLQGAMSKSIIVPRNVEVDIGDGNIGHNSVFYIDGYEKAEGSCVPIYKSILDKIDCELDKKFDDEISSEELIEVYKDLMEE